MITTFIFAGHYKTVTVAGDTVSNLFETLVNILQARVEVDIELKVRNLVIRVLENDLYFSSGMMLNELTAPVSASLIYILLPANVATQLKAKSKTVAEKRDVSPLKNLLVIFFIIFYYNI